jgi:hypothetical protein
LTPPRAPSASGNKIAAWIVIVLRDYRYTGWLSSEYEGRREPDKAARGGFVQYLGN